jgi:hypothetical protein
MKAESVNLKASIVKLLPNYFTAFKRRLETNDAVKTILRLYNFRNCLTDVGDPTSKKTLILFPVKIV